MGQMRDQRIRLPVGLYRTDSLMGAILSYALDPGRHIWEDYRIHVHPKASWQIEPARWWRLKDLRAYVRRYLRQARGTLEKAAFADHLVNRRCSPAALPGTAQEMVLEWKRRCPAEYRHLAQKHHLINQALESIRQSSSTPSENLEPELFWHN